MRSGRLERLGAWGIGALLLLLIHVLCPLGSARASCGSLVTSRFDRLRDFNHLDALIVDGSTVGQTDGFRGGERPSRPKPCSGPTCSNQDPAPASAAAPETGHLDRWGDLSVQALLAISSRPHRIVDGPPLHPEGHGPSIFHPPPVSAPRPL